MGNEELDSHTLTLYKEVCRGRFDSIEKKLDSWRDTMEERDLEMKKFLTVLTERVVASEVKIKSLEAKWTLIIAMGCSIVGGIILGKLSGVL